MLQLCQSGKSELSLGYEALLIPHAVYDFEQVDPKPHHLALVHSGRCGKTCKILDKGIKVILLNEDGTLNQDNIQMALEEFPKAIEIMGDEEKTKLFEVLGGLIPATKVEDEVSEDEAEKEKTMDEDEPEKKEEEMKDSDIIASFKDSEEFQTILDSHAHEMADAIAKAKNWIEGYDAKGKSLEVIMKDTVSKARPSVALKDCEIPVAFKMLDAKPVKVVTVVKDSEPKHKIIEKD